MLGPFLFLTLSSANFIGFRIFAKFETQGSLLPYIVFIGSELLIVLLLGKFSAHALKKGIVRPLSRRLSDWVLAFVVFFIFFFVCKLPWFLSERVIVADSDSAETKYDLMSRRAYLIEQVSSFSLSSMPPFFQDTMKKEWAIGTLSMTASALTNLAFRYPETRASSLKVVDELIERMLKDDIRSFETDWWGIDPIEALGTQNGNIGYLGHLNLMLGAHSFMGGDSRYAELHSLITSALVRRINENSFPYLETFPDWIFTADNAVVLASIALHGRVNHVDYSALISRWIQFTQSTLIDPKSGGIVFNVSTGGRPIGENRGSAAGWFSFYLPFVDRGFAEKQFSHLSASMTHEMLGIKWKGGFWGVREYLPGYEGHADIDSGPVIFGLSTSGTGFAVAGATYWKANKLLQGFLNTAEFVGSSFSLRGKRCYLLAPLIGDAIMLSMRTATDWDERYLSSHSP